jgi:hypothetical protein
MDAGLLLYGMVFGTHPFTNEGDQQGNDCFAAGRRSAKYAHNFFKRNMFSKFRVYNLII